jgi:hypothetical protein
MKVYKINDNTFELMCGSLTENGIYCSISGDTQGEPFNLKLLSADRHKWWSDTPEIAIEKGKLLLTEKIECENRRHEQELQNIYDLIQKLDYILSDIRRTQKEVDKQ